MQSIRRYLLVDEIIDLLENEKGLCFDSKLSKEKFKLYLIQYNYNFFVKGLKHKLMFDEKGKYKKEFDSNQVRYLFDIDRRVSTIVFKYFKSFELLLNNAITSILSKEINRITGAPYIAALSKNEFLEIFENYTQVYKQQKKINSNDFTINQNFIGLVGEFFKNYSSVDFYPELAFKNKDSEPKEII
ncbi:MAG: Abi family protein, partial [Malacoplasma sp.]|nr:Abi family protein [Malacoplasma sp.]